jgi:hypothetical protein
MRQDWPRSKSLIQISTVGFVSIGVVACLAVQARTAEPTGQPADWLAKLVQDPSGAGAASPGSDDPATYVAPYPSDLASRGWPAVLREIDERMTAWAVDIEVSTMSVQERDATIDKLWHAITHRPEDFPDEMFWFRELSGRIKLICPMLPGEDSRVQNFCPRR